MLARNNVEPSKIWERDFALKDTLEDLREHCVGAAEAGFKRPLVGLTVEGEITRQGKKFGVGGLMDGNPSYTLLTTPREGTRVFFGPFHLVINVLKWTFATFELTVVDSLLEVVGKKTFKQKAYVKSVGDPTFPMQICRECIITMKVAAAEAMIEETGITEPPSTRELEDWLWKKADSCPALRCALKFAAEVEIAMYIVDCERSSNPKGFVEAIKFAARSALSALAPSTYPSSPSFSSTSRPAAPRSWRSGGTSCSPLRPRAGTTRTRTVSSS